VLLDISDYFLNRRVPLCLFLWKILIRNDFFGNQIFLLIVMNLLYLIENHVLLKLRDLLARKNCLPVDKHVLVLFHLDIARQMS